MIRHKKRRITTTPLASESVEEEEDTTAAVTIRSEGNVVYFYADVTKTNVLKLIGCLHEATMAALRQTPAFRDPEVVCYIHSDGGDAFSGLSAYDHIRRNRVPVTTIADGMVASSASIMLLGGSRRLAHQHSFVLIHQLSVAGFFGKYVDLLDEVQNSTDLMNNFRSIYQDRTKLTTKRMEQLLKKELMLDARMCLQEGFVEELV